MKKLRYILKIIKNLSFENLFKTVNLVSKKTGKFKFLILIDIVYCGFVYGAGYNDYLHFGFYNLKRKDRKTFLTRSLNNKLVSLLNKREDVHFLDSKHEFNERYSSFLKRDWLYLNDFSSFLKFCKNKDAFIAKLDDGTGGHGIEIIDINGKNLEDVFNYLKEKKLILLEELIIQKDYLNKIYPKSVNTVRIVTITNKGKTELLTAYLRVGNGSFVDNTCSGGILIPLDINTGVTSHPGIDLMENLFEVHPITKEKLVSLKIEDWKECVKLVKEAALITPSIRYNAWDVAISLSGPCLIEGNPYPFYQYQFPIFVGNKGHLIRVREIFKKLNIEDII